jgi:hypothetical protein
VTPDMSLAVDFIPIGCDLRAELIAEYDLGVTRQDWYEGAQITQWAGSDGAAVILDRFIPTERIFQSGCTHYMAVLL